MSDKLKVLIVDSNSVLAKRIGSKLIDHLKNTEIDYARNIVMLKAKMKTSIYDFVVADVYSMSEPRVATDVLSKASCPVVVWTVLECAHCADKESYKCQMNECTLNNMRKIIRKPAHFDDVSLRELFNTVSIAHEHTLQL